MALVLVRRNEVEERTEDEVDFYLVEALYTGR
ncbi:hypothetical protein IPA_00915 [Ignicoccus pacificus DSM 13166]|uniref:Uncharacterized protein n=1 Tax=Ignicoccus pacificus DSM 13166 TaxID=940294 RepID=A0A977KBV4_9CREN|nr:hypothetical protein IPA_00915 [Ignicoccus pacificus DSM 13166]